MNAYLVRDPRTGQAVRSLRPPADLAAEATALRDAQEAWQAMAPAARARVLLCWRDAIEAAQDDLVAALMADTGRLTESVMEVRSVLGMLDRWAAQAPDLLASPTARATAVPGLRVAGDATPYPLVGVISPWNFPLLLGLIDAIPALAAGCAVLAKPSEVTPRFIAPLARTLQDVPELDAVLTLVEGAGDVGAAMIDLVDAVVFTGSVPTGRKVAAAAAAAFIPAFLELGGKDAAIVLDGADLDRAAAAILWGGTANAGQSCLSIERVYVEEPSYAEFVERLTAKAQRLRLAHPTIKDGQIGPLIDPAQADVIEHHLADAYAKGAAASCGGAVERLGGGLWCHPTVLTGVTHDMLIMTEETFAPILPVMPARDVDHAVTLANDSVYGLSAAVFADSPEAALPVAARLEAGAISINDAALTAFVHEGEKNSRRNSGLGPSRMGPAALTRFLRTRAYLINNSQAPDPWWH